MAENTGKKVLPKTVSPQIFTDDEPTDPGIKLPAGLSIETAPPRPQKMPELGPIDNFIKDPEVTEIMINDTRNVMIEKAGKVGFSGYTVQTQEELARISRALLDFTNLPFNYEYPYVDTSLPDGSRVNLIGPPLTVNGPCITIRKFPAKRLSADDLIRLGMMDKRIGYFLNMSVLGRMNILISGGTGGGKTTLLNALTAFIPAHERIVTIEDTRELVIPHANSVQLVTKAHTPTQSGISARELLANALRMRPDRILVGECRRAEAFDMLQAMNTGHEGSMTTIHANSPRDALSRLETLCMTSGVDLPLIAIRKQIISALDLVVQIKRLRSGRRIVHAISEVTGMEGNTITMLDLFNFNFDSGTFAGTGLVPTFVDRLAESGLEFPKGFFR